MKNLFAALIVLLIFVSCKKEQNQTGIELLIDGPELYGIEIIVGSPLQEVTDINQWRPDVVFWAHTKNKFIPLKAGEYTIVLQNLSTSKMASELVTVRHEQVVTVRGSL